jgi:hypothetical protein
MPRQGDAASLAWPGKAILGVSMPNTEKDASREESAMRVRLRTWRWIRRLDTAVASVLLLLLIFGWVVR